MATDYFDVTEPSAREAVWQYTLVTRYEMLLCGHRLQPLDPSFELLSVKVGQGREMIFVGARYHPPAPCYSTSDLLTDAHRVYSASDTERLSRFTDRPGWRSEFFIRQPTGHQNRANICRFSANQRRQTPRPRLRLRPRLRERKGSSVYCEKWPYGNRCVHRSCRANSRED